MLLRTLLACTLLYASIIPVAAENGLSLDEAIKSALAGNPNIAAAGHELQAADAAYRGARALPNPEVVITPGILGPAGSDEEISIVQPLEINGARKAKTNAAAGEARASQASMESVKLEIVRRASR